MKDITQNYIVTVGKKRNNPFKMNYSVFGNGNEKVFIISGFLSKSKYLSSTANYFQSLGKYTIVTFDQCGLGESESVNVNSIEDLASDALELIEHLKWDNINVIGCSLGTLIGYELCKIANERIKTFNMFCPANSLKFCNLQTIKNVIIYPFFIDPILHNKEPSEVFINSIFSQSFLNAPSLIKNGTNLENLAPLFISGVKETSNLPLITILRYCFLTMFYKIRPVHKDKETLLNRRYPISIFVGTNDTMIHWKSLIKTCEIVQPNKIFVCNSANHAVHLEDFEQVHKQAEQFFSYKKSNDKYLNIQTLEFKNSNLKPWSNVNPFLYRSTPFTQLPIFNNFKKPNLISLFSSNLKLILRK